jgi:hypothetical protein
MKKVRDTSLIPCLDGIPLESPRAQEAARLLLLLTLYARQISWEVEDQLTKARRQVPLEEVEIDDEVALVQNQAAQMETIRGVVAMLAGTRAGRRESARRARDRNTPEARQRKAAERAARELAWHESTKHLTEGQP